MKIKYLGHSSFLLTDNAGTSIVTDPYAPQVGFKMPKVEADAVTLSHQHFDHNYASAVGGNPQIFDKAARYKVGGVEICGVKSFHDSVQGKMRGENIIFKFRIDGLNICHLGDLGEACSPELISAILPADILLIPVGGNYTIDAQTAKTYVEKINPRYVIPMHYRTAGGTVDIDGVEKFLNLFDGSAVEEYNLDEVELVRGDLSGDNTRIIVLRRA